MTKFIRAITLTITLLLALPPSALAQQQATLVIHNNTGATISVETQNMHNVNVQSAALAVQPGTIGRLSVPMGQSFIFADAIHVNGRPEARWTYNFHHSGSHELQIFDRDFGMHSMFDAPGATAEPQAPTEPAALSAAERAALVAIGILEEPTRGTDCSSPTVNPAYFLLQFVNNCPSGFITRGRHPPGGSECR